MKEDAVRRHCVFFRSMDREESGRAASIARPGR
jgi:hypothetical protein